MMSRLLVPLLLCLWGQETSGEYCMDQPTQRESFLGGTVTIPCWFTFPQDKAQEINITVRASDRENNCVHEKDEIYNSSGTSFSFPGRLNVQVDKDHRNATMTLHNVTADDAKYYCCRVKLTFKGSAESVRFQNFVGTKVSVKGDNVPSLETTPDVFAAPGENVTLLSRIRMRNGNTSHNITACHVQGSSGTNQGDCSVQNSILSFRINQVTQSQQGPYWWKIETSTSDGNTMSSNNPGPELQIIDKTNTLNVSQPEEAEFHNPTTINCSFTVKEKKNVLRTEIYWMVGEPREDYVYHPNPDYVHPDYRGKTRLVDGSNLLLTDYHGPDNTTFYCRVIMRRCVVQRINPNDIETILGDGAGTLLRFQNIQNNSPSISPSILSIVLSGVIVFLVILISLIIYLIKRQGNKQHNSREAITETTEKKEDQNDENLVYSTINHSFSSTQKKTTRIPDPNTEVVYADVKKN